MFCISTMGWDIFTFFFTVINLLTVAVHTYITYTHYNNIVTVIFGAELVSKYHANHM